MRIADVRAVLVDIEGTASPTAAVHGALFDDARRELDRWLRANAAAPSIAAAIDEVRTTAALDGDDLDGVIAELQRWIDEDRKATPLKTIQGGIWAEGFAAGRLDAVVFADVAAALRRWKHAGAELAVFSSGSVAVQAPWFAAAGLGDVFSAFFDTVSAGPKKEAPSYERIVAAYADRGYDAADIVFLSDVPAELDAAAKAGIRTVGLARPGEPFGDADFGEHPTVTTFADLDIAVATVPTDEEITTVGADLAATSAALAANGWMRATAGNVSAVVRHAPLQLVVSASGVDKSTLDADDCVLIDAVGAAVPRPGIVARRPSAEGQLHAAIAAITGAGAVVHIHAIAAVVAADRWPDGVPLTDIEMVKSFGADADSTVIVPVIANSQSMDELASRFAAHRVPDVPAVIVARHGMYVWGDDLDAARHRAEGLVWCLEFVTAIPPSALPERNHS